MLSFNCLLESLHDKSATQIPYLKNFLNIFIEEKNQTNSLDITSLLFLHIASKDQQQVPVLLHSSLLFYISALIKTR